MKRAKQIGQSMNLTLLESSGHLVAFHIMVNVYPESIDVSVEKTKTLSLFYDFTTAGLFNVTQPGGSLYCLEETNGGLVVFRGELPIYVNKVLIGSFGVSGGSVHEDVTVTKAGVKLFK